MSLLGVGILIQTNRLIKIHCMKNKTKQKAGWRYSYTLPGQWIGSFISVVLLLKSWMSVADEVSPLLYPPIFPSEMDVGIVTTVVIFSVCLHVGILETPQHCYGSIFSMSFELCYLPHCMHSNEGLWTCNKSAAAASSLSPSQPRVPFSQSRVCTLC